MKAATVVGVIVILVILMLSGCTNQEKTKGNQNGGGEPKTVTMTVEELGNDMVPTSLIGGMVFKSLADGDTLIINDTVPTNFSYDPVRNASTMIYSYTYTNGTFSSGRYFINIQGNITDQYKPQDKYRLTVHIKHVNLQWENQTIELECFAEQWVSQDYYFNNFATGGLKPLPQNCIENCNSSIY